MKDYAADRAGLIAHLSAEIKDRRVLDVMSRIPREKFVPEESRHLSYDDGPLPIGWEQTISQPYIIALMTQELELTGKEKVLEIGTGSGYQTAILAELSKQVISVERVPALAESARKVLDSLRYTNIEIHIAGETLGWPDGAPYDAILIAQLANGGRMVIPAGSRYVQELCKVVKSKDGNRLEKLGGCRFVALIGKDAWSN
jgi:protein-L-isoaspartate(D-aspartate) O-methyltransferase